MAPVQPAPVRHDYVDNVCLGCGMTFYGTLDCDFSNIGVFYYQSKFQLGCTANILVLS